MTARPPDPRRRFIDLLETEATKAGCETSSHFARHFAARMDAEGLTIVAIPDHQPPATGHLTPAQDLADRVPEYTAARKALKDTK